MSIKKFSFFLSDSDKPRMLFFLLINVKMPIVGILTFMSRKHFMLNSVEHEKKFYNLGASFFLDKC